MKDIKDYFSNANTLMDINSISRLLRSKGYAKEEINNYANKRRIELNSESEKIEVKLIRHEVLKSNISTKFNSIKLTASNLSKPVINITGDGVDI